MVMGTDQRAAGESVADQNRPPMLGLAIYLWLCALPFALITLGPRLGLARSIAVVSLLLVLAMAVCLSLCRMGKGGGRSQTAPCGKGPELKV
ncbi:MAG TPA: hypothetical protein VGL40_06355 [Bacillota bacterium]